MSSNPTRGSVLVMMVVFLPVLIGTAFFTLATGRLVYARAVVQASADLGALAALNNVDLARLARGERWIDPEAAIRDARLWAQECLMANLSDILELSEVVIDVAVDNPGEDGYPSVTVAVTVNDLRLRGIPVPVNVSCKATAAVGRVQ
ncbi:MAG: pilus assembly protein TadG-related protein [Bacillota bacterium]